MNADGSNQTRLTDDPAAEFSPSWSPDGKWILYRSELTTYVMDADGNNKTRLATEVDGPVWSPILPTGGGR